MKKLQLLLVGLYLLVLNLSAARVDTVMVHSPSMNKMIQAVIIVPDVATAATPVNCPVVYLLHGYGGNAYTWLAIKPHLPQLADEKGIILVCPDAANSWYWDSPEDPNSRYETFVSSELVAYTDSHYATIAHRRGRAITGLSMGGHGGMWLSIRHTDVFGAGGSMSGGVDIRPFPNNWEMAKQLGSLAQNQEVWNQHTVVNQLDKIKNGDLAIIIDCGYKDFFWEVNQDLHHRLLALAIDHDYITRPGEHTASYWHSAIDYQLLFFRKFFNRKVSK